MKYNHNNYLLLYLIPHRLFQDKDRIAVKDRVVGIIGDYDNARAAREAVVMLINGKQPSTIYRWLQRWRRELNLRRVEGGFTGYT